MQTIEVVGLGVSTVDILCVVDHFPAQEEVQPALEFAIQGGGPVATAMVALARLGARTAMIDSVGDDWHGTLIREGFRKENVSTNHIKTHEGFTSPTACVLVQKSGGARSIIAFPGTAPEVSPKDLPYDVIRSARFLHVNGRHWKACMEAVRFARRQGVSVSFDGGAHRYRPQLQELVPLVDICIVARDFAEKYTRQGNVADSAELLLKEGPSVVVITDGIRGSWICSHKAPLFHQPAFRVEGVRDTTGCGDSYHGAFLFGLLRGMQLPETASLASAVAALNSLRLGGRSGIPRLNEVQSFLSGMPTTIDMP